MRFTLTSLIRLISVLALVICSMAVGLSRSMPRVIEGPRALVEPRLVGVNGSIFTPPVSNNFLLDRETGALVECKFAESDHALDYASIAPWIGEQGEIEVAGRYVERFEIGSDKHQVSLGVARYDYQSGTLKNSAEVNPVVAGTPCWLPGARRRVLFPAGGDLYLQEFRDENDEATPLQKVSVGTAFPNRGRIVFHDVLCPTLPEMRGRLIVSINFSESKGKHGSWVASELWSLEFDASRAAIVSAEPVLDPSMTKGSVRLPSLAKTPSGGTVLAYLEREGRFGSWTLRLAPVRFESEKHTPRADGRNAIRIEGYCAASRPEFSIDGQFIHRIRKLQPSSSSIDRISVEQSFLAGSTSVAVAGLR